MLYNASQSPITVSRTFVHAEYGAAFQVKKGQKVKVIDLHGQQVVDFIAFMEPDYKEKLSMAFTRYHLSGGAIAEGDWLWTNADRKIARVIEDKVKVHDMTYMYTRCFISEDRFCNPGFYEKLGQKEHRSCQSNFTEALAPYKIERFNLPDPWNLFQNTPNYSIKGNLETSRPGDYIVIEFVEDALVAVSACPFTLDGYLPQQSL